MAVAEKVIVEEVVVVAVEVVVTLQPHSAALRHRSD